MFSEFYDKQKCTALATQYLMKICLVKPEIFNNTPGQTSQLYLTLARVWLLWRVSAKEDGACCSKKK